MVSPIFFGVRILWSTRKTNNFRPPPKFQHGLPLIEEPAAGIAELGHLIAEQRCDTADATEEKKIAA